MTSQEKQEILARLAATEAASLIAREIGHSSTSDEALACFRIMEKLNVPAAQVTAVYRSMVTHLQNADLAINFRLKDFFSKPVEGSRILNTWDRDKDSDDYLTTRNTVEERLFNYSNIRRGSGHKTPPIGTTTRMRLFGSRNNNPFFKPGIRPKYGALNFANLADGPARGYGESFFVLKDYIKHNSTFFPGDSFKANDADNSSDMVANYFDMHRIILYMEERMLRALHSAATGAAVTGLPRNDYIEAQLHTDVVFSRDIKRICISNFDISVLGNDTNRVKSSLEQFSHTHNIRLIYH